MLAFDAAAEVELSDGTVCTVNAPTSHIRAKGYKHAVPDAALVQGGSFRLLSRIDAGAAAGGYGET